MSLNGSANKATCPQGYGTEQQLEEPNSMTPTVKKVSAQEMDVMNINRQSDHLKESVSGFNAASCIWDVASK